MSIKIQGKIKSIFPEQTFGSFKKRVVWIEEVEVQWPNTFEIQFTQAKTAELDGYKEGDFVEIDTDIRGRFSEKDGKQYVFNSLVGWRINKAGEQPATNNQNTHASLPAAPKIGKDDDLPF